MIPKRLVTTWITDGQRDLYTDDHRRLFASCLGSWLKEMPDWEVVVVTAGNLFALGTNRVVEQWLRDGHFIGASQWARLFWLQMLGGIYVDMDVKAHRSFEPLRQHQFFAGHEGGDDFANNATIGSIPGHPFLQAQLDHVLRCDPADPQFGNETGPRMLTRLLRARGWSGQDRDETVDTGHGHTAHVCASDVLYPVFYQPTSRQRGVTDRTLAIHLWGSSWVRP